MRLFLPILIFASTLFSNAASLPQKRGFFFAPTFLPVEDQSIVISAGPDIVWTNSMTFPLVGTVSGGKGLSFLWTKIVGPTATIDQPNNLSTLATASVNGTYEFMLTATDGQRFKNDTVTVTVNTSAVNTAPTVTTPPAQNGFEDTALGPVALTVGDAETAAGSLTIDGFASDVSIVPASGVIFGGSGASRTVTITPAPNQSGVVNITILVSDGTATTSTSFSATFAAVNDAPTISQSSPQSTPEDIVKVVSFTVGDQETAAGSLTLVKSSSNQTLVADANIVLGGSGANRTATITPGLNQTGSATITIIVSDGSLTATNAFLFVVGAVNDPPTISAIANQAVNEDTTTSALAFTISDLETAAASLTVSGNSTNLALLPIANIVFGGSGGSRTVTLTPASNVNGVSTVTISVSDGTNSVSTAFTFTVNPINDPPTISALANQAVVQPNSTGALSFTIGDLETAVGSLTVTRASGNTTLIPLANIVLGGSGANRTVTVTPAANQTGSTTITVTVNDGTTTANSAFTITVTSGNTPPTVTTPANQNGFEDTVIGPVAFTVGDAQTAAGSLTVTRTSSNTSLVPLANAVLGGSGASRTITLTPVSNLSGQTTITLTVTDGGGLTTTTSFVSTFSAVNDFPQFTSIIGAQNGGEDSTTGPLSFGISDQETPAASLLVTVSRTNTALFPSGSIVLGGSGATRTITFTPATNAFGQDQFTVLLSDGAASVGMAFNVTVNAVNDPPTMNPISNTIGTAGVATTVNFTANDVESGGNLTYTKTSSNAGVVPVANIIFGGSGTARTASVTATASGTSTLTFRGTDSGGLFVERSFTFTASGPANTPPTISNPGSQSTPQNVVKNTNVTVGDAEDGPDPLTLHTVTSSNPTLLPVGNIFFSGCGATRMISMFPATNQFGSTTVTVKVRDTAGAETTIAFALTVTQVSSAPVVTAITAKSMTEDIPIQVPVSATDPDSATLTWTATSSVQGVVANAGLSIPGTGLSATLTITPVANASGTTVITVTANDGSQTGQKTFTLTVTAANDLPTITDISNKGTSLNTASGPHPFTVGDVETAAAALTVTGSSGNTTLVPNANIVFTGSGANRNVTVTPATGQSGQVTITITVNDGTGGMRTDTFVLTVSGGVNPEYYVSTSGSFSNPGTLASPWNMDRGLSVVSGKPEVASKVWIRGGIYNAEYDSDATGVVYDAYQGEIVRIGPRDPEVGHIVFSLHGANNKFWRLVWDCDVKQSEAEGIYSSDSGAGNEFIFCLVKDLPQGWGLQDNRPSGGGFLIYGSVGLFCGWDNSPTDPGGHIGYFQNMGNQFRLRKTVLAYSHSKTVNSGGSEAAGNRNWLISDNIILWDGGASQAAYDLGRPVEYIAFVGNDPIRQAIYRDNFHVGGHVLFGYPDPLNFDLLVAGNFEIHPGFANGTFSGLQFNKFQTLIITNNVVDSSFENAMDLNNSGAVSRNIDRNSYFGNQDFDPGGTFAGWRGNGWDLNGSSTSSHWSTLYIQYERFSEYPNEPERAHVAFWNPQSQSSISLDGAQCGLVSGDQYSILNTLHPDMTLPHKFRVATSGTYTGSPISVPVSGLLVATPKGKSSPPPNCYPKSGALLVKKTN